MKLDFDPKKNITRLDHFIIPLNKVNFKIRDLLVVRSIVKNWHDILLFRIGLKKPGFVMQLRNGKKIKINRPEDYFSSWEAGESQLALLKQFNLNRQVKIIERRKIIEFRFSNRLLRFHYDSHKQLYNTLNMIKEQFIEEQYKWLSIKNKIVIDIGANIGDSAIYFALRGARHIYALEPYPYSYKLAMQNIKLNRLQNKITLLNEGCGEEKRKIKIYTNYKNFGGTDLKNFKGGTAIGITTLDELVKRFNIIDNGILKIDCEGCEYGALLKAKDSVLRKFKQIQVEYHYGYLNIKRKLKKSKFKIIDTIPKYSTNSDAENKEMLIGFIYAKKIE